MTSMLNSMFDFYWCFELESVGFVWIWMAVMWRPLQPNALNRIAATIVVMVKTFECRIRWHLCNLTLNKSVAVSSYHIPLWLQIFDHTHTVSLLNEWVKQKQQQIMNVNGQTNNKILQRVTISRKNYVEIEISFGKIIFNLFITKECWFFTCSCTLLMHDNFWSNIFRCDMKQIRHTFCHWVALRQVQSQ